MEKVKTMKFRDGPLPDLISELEREAVKWCDGHCLDFGTCFENPAYHLEQIERCGKLPKIYKLYWRARARHIIFVFPLVICKTKENNHG